MNIFNNTIVNATLGGYFTQDEVSVNNFKNNIVVVPDRDLVLVHLGKTDAAVRHHVVAGLRRIVDAC